MKATNQLCKRINQLIKKKRKKRAEHNVKVETPENNLM